MPVIISGSTGISGTDGSAATPALQGTDTNTGVFFPAADTIAFAEGGTEVMRINASGQVEYTLGTASLPSITATGDTNTGIYFPGADRIGFAEGGVQVGEFDASGNFLFNSGYGSAATAYGCRAWVHFSGIGTVAIRASGNVSSITDLGVGIYQCNFTTSLTDTNYAAFVDMRPSVSNNGSDTFPINYLTTSIEVRHFEDGVARDSDNVNVAVFR
jgi:hypothetical protein